MYQDDPENPDLIEGLPVKKLFETMSAFAGVPMADHQKIQGSKLGGYEIEEEIDRGGMGIVYKARQPGVNRTVAIKVLRSGGLAGEEELSRFESEAELLGQLDHTNIVPVYDVGEAEGQPYIAMKYFEGGSLVEREGDFVGDEKRTVALLIQLAEAISEVHRRGIIHRDLKPSNILLDGEGEPHISDFGLSRLLDDDSQMTMSGSVLGSPNYISPELAKGDRDQVTTAVDVYGLGAILYHCLTGKPPFEGSTPLEVLRKVTGEDPVPPRSVRAGIDRDLETICLKCLERDPRRRYPSARALKEDLCLWQRGESIGARPATGFERVAQWARRSPWRAGLAVVLVAGSVAFFVTNVLYQRDLEESRDIAQDFARQTEQANIRLKLERADVEIASGRQREGMRYLLGVLEEDPDNRVAAERLAYEWGRRNFPVPVFPAIHCNRPVYKVVYSEDGSRFATAVANGNLQIWNAENGEPIGEPLFHDRLVDDFDLNADGTRLLFRSEHDYWLWDFAGELPALLYTREEASRIREVRLLSDSIILEKKVSAVVLRDAATGEVVERIPLIAGTARGQMCLDHEREVAIIPQRDGLYWWDLSKGMPLGGGAVKSVKNLALSGDGSRLLIVAPDNTMQLWDARERESIGEVFTRNLVVYGVDLNESGDRCVLALAGGRLEVIDPMTGEFLAEPLREEGSLTDVAFRPGKEEVATASTTGDVKVLSVGLTNTRKPSDADYLTTRNRFSADGSLRLQRSNEYKGSLSTKEGRIDMPDDWSVWDFSVAPDGAEIAVVDMEKGQTGVYLCDPENIENRREIWRRKKGRMFVNYSPEGRYLVVTHEDEGLLVWNCATESVEVEKADFPGAWYLSFHPDGESILIPGPKGALTRWSLKTGEKIEDLLDHGNRSVEAAAMSNDGSTLVTGGADMRGRIWKPEGEGWTEVDEAGFGGEVRWAEFSPKGEAMFLVGARDGKVRVWNSETREPLCKIVASEMALTLAQFTTDGEHILTVSMDGYARIWDARTGLPVTSPMRHDEWWAVPEPKMNDAGWLEEVVSSVKEN